MNFYPVGSAQDHLKISRADKVQIKQVAPPFTAVFLDSNGNQLLKTSKMLPSMCVWSTCPFHVCMFGLHVPSMCVYLVYMSKRCSRKNRRISPSHHCSSFLNPDVSLCLSGYFYRGSFPLLSH